MWKVSDPWFLVSLMAGSLETLGSKYLRGKKETKFHPIYVNMQVTKAA